ncbi:hypothetical protein P9112_000929 [Eukaryota sp. TZLM1-RC]
MQHWWQQNTRHLSRDWTYRPSYINLHFTTTVDAAGHTFPLAFGVVENEHYDSWKWFIEQLKKVFDLTGITVISDRQKGLIKAVGETLQTSAHAFCVKHLADNANGKGSKKARPFIFRLAKCGSKVEYEKLLREMTLVSPVAANYIRNTAEPHHWVEYQFPGNRCGHVTSNIVECVNACIAEARQLPIYICLNRLGQCWRDGLLREEKKHETYHQLLSAEQMIFWNRDCYNLEI